MNATAYPATKLANGVHPEPVEQNVERERRRDEPAEQVDVRRGREADEVVQQPDRAGNESVRDVDRGRQREALRGAIKVVTALCERSFALELSSPVVADAGRRVVRPVEHRVADVEHQLAEEQHSERDIDEGNEAVAHPTSRERAGEPGYEVRARSGHTGGCSRHDPAG